MRPSRTYIAVFALPFLLAIYAQAQSQRPFNIVVQGGAGTIIKSQMSPEIEAQYRSKLTEAITVGYKLLESGGSSLDAVETVIRILEDSPLFNAGKGAVFTHERTNELDASIMDGKTLKAGAVAGVKHIKNPISLARMVMERSPHVMLVGEGAEKFAQDNGVTLVSAEYFHTERRWNELQKAIEKERLTDSLKSHPESPRGQYGTVGCVALDKAGNLAAGTSTGGTTNKRFGRVGDSPIIGAGTYANNATCAVSATGTGEYFIRSVVAYDISALMEYEGLSVRKAAERVIMDKLPAIHGDGGVIAMDKHGNFAMPFNTAGMYRAYIDAKGRPVVLIYKDE